MFLGNMQSFYRRNSIHHQPSSSHGSPSKPSKGLIKRVRNLSNKDGGEDDEDCSIRNSSTRRRSFSISRNIDCEEVDEYNRNDVPIIKIELFESKPTKQTFNILKEKEKALWYNTCSETDNSERLGPNTNNIIEESLKSENKQTGHEK